MDSSRVDEDGQSMVRVIAYHAILLLLTVVQTVISKQQPEFQTLEREWAARCDIFVSKIEVRS